MVPAKSFTRLSNTFEFSFFMREESNTWRKNQMESIRWPFLETQEGSTQAGIDVYYESQFLTISEIVELLTPSSPLRHHPEAIYHFFYTYKMFTTPEFFLMLIKKRYANIPESLSQAKYFIRLGVYLVLSLWLNMEFEE